ncbi:hypothetical protein LOTGIDRAFT_152226 [Lottia gigantea]|uniref:CUB domain-containing protein n=1 Tax=Lottia gigantea TaxID=225164 RepID=V4BCJ5_LOTGI|nr:hypothetical protein LOTGIDRAFT_152226 [Lottia gigantea]ESP05376.1 hypothetical protein LOTGIDRAFT_152226 [Lottia gigantea]
MLLIFSIFVTALTSVKGCDQVLIGDNGTISSPGWPMRYPLNIECTYDIIVSEGNRVRIEFVNMSVETSSGCGYDSVKIYDTNTSNVLDTLCGYTTGQVYHSSANFMTVVFNSDDVQDDYGFVAVFSSEESRSKALLQLINITILGQSDFLGGRKI